MSSPLIILASRSARRAQLLREAGYAFIQADPPFADPPEPEMGDASVVTLELARRKAQSLYDTGILQKYPGAVILAADTVCVGTDGRLLGQPANRESAQAMILSFSGQAHRVVSGVSVQNMNSVHIDFVDAAEVRMAVIPSQEIDLYLDTQQWIGKAGGYNLFDRQNAGWPIVVEGDPATVVGLPMQKLKSELAKLSIHPARELHSHTDAMQA